MPKNASLILAAILVVVAMLTIACSGGGGSSGGSPAALPQGTIYGRIVAPAELSLSMRGNSKGAAVARALVWLEQNPDNTTLTDENGDFILTGVIMSKKYRIVSRYDSNKGGETYLARTSELVLTPGQQSIKLDDIELQKGTRSICGTLKNQLGDPVIEASISLWGMEFKPDSSGRFVSPKLPADVDQEMVQIKAVGYKDLELKLPFTEKDNSLIYFNLILSDSSEPNISPVPYFVQIPDFVSPGEKVKFILRVIDPDEMRLDQFKPEWQATAGIIQKVADPLEIYWTAPETSGLATLTVKVKDSRGAEGNTDLKIAVGGIKTAVIRIDDVEPSAASPETQVVISGSGFGNDKNKISISFNGKIAAVHSCTENQIVTEVPAGSTSGILLLTCNSLEKSAGVFTVLDRDLVVSPGYGPPGTIFTISGSDIEANEEKYRIELNGIEAEIVEIESGSIKAIIPDKAKTGIVNLKAGEKNRLAGMFKVSVVHSIFPLKTRLGDKLTIIGEGWGSQQKDSAIKFAGGKPAIIKSWNDEKIEFIVPEGAVTGDLAATIQNQQFQIAELQIVSIYSLDPHLVTTSDLVEITGTGFGSSQGDSKIKIAGVEADIIDWSENLIKIRVPGNARPGPVKIELSDNISNAVDLKIIGIVSVSASRLLTGSRLTINGFGFQNSAGYVFFGEEVIDRFIGWSDNRIEVTVPETVEGSSPIIVSNLGIRTSPFNFIAAIVDGLDEIEGWPGREITISGSYFGERGASEKVCFGELEAPILSWQDSEIKVRVPEGAVNAPVSLVISDEPIVVLPDFIVHREYEYEQIYPEWSGPRVNSRPWLCGIAYGNNDSYFVTDFDNGWVWQLSNLNEQSKFGNFSNPWGIAFNPQNSKLYIADSGNDCVRIYDTEGNLIETKGDYGSAPGQFNTPRGICFDADGRLYVADTGNNRIQIFDPDGDFLLELGAYGAGNGMFVSPSGVAIDTNLNLFVADTGNHRVQKFLPDDLTSPSTWSFAGWLGSSDPNVPTLGWQLFGSSLISEQEGGFYNPYGVGISNDGHLLVADTNNNRVQVFNSGSGQFINLIGAAGITSGQYNQPLAVIFADEQVVIADSSNARIQISTIAGAYSGEIAPDTSLLTTEPVRIVTDSKNQKVYVLDKQDSSVTVFNMNGEVIEVLGSKGSGREQFYDPEGMAIDSNGSLYIADTGNARVQILSPQGQFNKSFGVYGTGSGQFIKPNAIAVSNDGNYIYVADASLQLIQKFDSQGNFINGWGSPGSGDAGFNYPSGMALDNENNLYVADQNNHRIKKYTSNGDLIGWWGSYDAGAQAFWLDPGSNRTGALSDADGGFDTPTDIAVDLEGNVYVTDSNNFRIQRFNSVQSQGEDAGFQTEIYIGDNLPAIAVDEWGRVYCLNSGKQVLRFEPDL